MRYIVSAAVAVLLAAWNGHACGPYWNYPQDYLMFRVMDKSVDVDIDFKQENCRLWRNVTSIDIPVEDINRVVYKYDLNQIESILTGKSDNLFCRWLKQHHDSEVVSYLLLAKKCEKVRLEMNSRWYYPSREDGVNMTLEQIAEMAMAYDGYRLADRYALQAVRALYTLGRFSEMITYWDEVCGDIPEGAVKNQAKGYVAGACLRSGDRERSLRLYQEIDDVWSIVESHGENRTSSLETLAAYCPDSPKTRRYIQDMVSSLEPYYTQLEGHVQRMHEPKIDPGKVDSFIKICLEAPLRENCANKQVWYYTAAFLQDLIGDPESASRSITKAESSRGDAFMNESVKVMRIYLDAKLRNYDRAYEARLLSQLRWYDEKIREGITDQVREDTMEGYLLKESFSFYYWNDMMRKVVLGEICPRMLERGNEVRALQLANYADNRLLDLVGTQRCHRYDQETGKYDRSLYRSMSEYRKKTNGNMFDFSNYFFTMADDMDVKKLIAYVGNLDDPVTEMDHFLNSRGYTGRDHLYEHIGTLFLRNLDYRNAVKYLSRVSSSYQSTTNVNDYMYRKPFDLRDKDSESIIPDYKLAFAREMAALERIVKNSSDMDKVGFALVRMGIGMRSSVGYCWTLTRYSLSEWDKLNEEPYTRYVKEKAESLIWEGLSKIKDREVAAKAYLAVQAYRTVAVDYSDTPTGKLVASQCDVYSDYRLYY